jgi:hypothetical protein
MAHNVKGSNNFAYGGAKLKFQMGSKQSNELTRFGEIINGMKQGGAYAFDKVLR